MDETTTIPIRLSHKIDYELKFAMARHDYDDRVKVSRFRSADLESYAQQTFPESCHTPFSESVERAFKDFVNARRKLVGAELPFDERVTAELFRPKSILVVDWESSLFDGAVTPETGGFIDDDCMPGWDSWLAKVRVPAGTPIYEGTAAAQGALRGGGNQIFIPREWLRDDWFKVISWGN